MQRTIWQVCFAVAALACAGLWTGFALQSRHETLRAAQERLGITARLLEQHADRALAAGDRALYAAVAAAGDPTTLDDPGRAEALHRFLRDLIAGSPQLASAWVLDARGMLVAENWPYPPRDRASYAHRSYYRTHAGADNGLHLGPMEIGTAIGRWRFTMSRPLIGGDGRFAGVIATGIFSAYFGDVFAEAGLGEGARLALRRADGTPLALWPPPDPARPELPTMDLAGPMPEPGAGAVRLSEDGRLVAVRRLLSFPVVI
ncbi:MAG: hypothetical protein K2X74_15515, partial [Acetobacteraceae bacterium]|nr:hypothetical protein [Acetobacteraceae bacterium]